MHYTTLLVVVFASVKHSCGCEEQYIDTQIVKNGVETSYLLYSCGTQPQYGVTKLTVKSCLKHLTENLFAIFPDLENLYLVQTSTQSMAPRFFTSTEHLKVICLKSNYITEIPFGIFSSLVLDMLDLAHNRINKVEDYALSALICSYLNLEDNHLIHVKEIWFRDSQIKHLNLANNKIMRIDRIFVESITNLQELNLNYNSIHKIDENIQATMLTKLHLAGNWITDLKCIKSLQLSYLDVSFNRIGYINHEDVAQVETLVATPNPWQCSCLLEFWKKCKNHTIFLEESLDVLYRWQENSAICGVPDFDGNVCSRKKDEKFFQAQENYFKIVDYAKLGRYGRF